MKQKSRFTGFFDQTPKSPERVQSPPDTGDSDIFQGSRNTSDDIGRMFGGKLHDTFPGEQTGRAQPFSNPISPEPMFPPNGNRDQQPSQTQQLKLHMGSRLSSFCQRPAQLWSSHWALKILCTSDDLHSIKHAECVLIKPQQYQVC